MNEELLDAAKEFDEYFIRKFPDVEHPVKLISDFNSTLNEYAQKSTKHGDTIHSITVLLSRTELEEFAAKNSQSDRRVDYEQKEGYDDENHTKSESRADEDDNEIIAEARKVVYGDEEEGGLKELVGRLINDLEADN